MSPAEVGVGGRHVVQALVVALVVIMLDERFDPALEVTGQEVVFLSDAVLQGLVPAFDLALSLWMERGTRTWLMRWASMYSASSPAM